MVLPMLMVSEVSSGQIFRQQSAKRKGMLEQILQLRLLHNSVRSGEFSADTGLRSAKAKKGAVFGQHLDHIRSLSQVNTAVSNDEKVGLIRKYAKQTRECWTNELKWQRQRGFLTSAEIKNVNAIALNINKKDELDLLELENIVKPGKMQLSDDERIQKLESTYRSILDKNAFTLSFTAKCRKLARSREMGKKERQQLKKLYGIH